MWLKSFQAKFLSPCYENVRFEFDRVNVFLGANNSGKTRLLATLFGVALNQVERRSTPDARLAKEWNAEFDAPLLPKTNRSTLGPICNLSAGVTAGSQFDSRQAQDAYGEGQHSSGGLDMLAELYRVPLLRPRIQFEIENLFAITIAFRAESEYMVLYAPDGTTQQELRLSDHGRGIQYYFSLFFYLYHPSIRVLFIDEPENSLHPQLQRTLISRIRTIAKEQDKQVFLATHSPIFALPVQSSDLASVFVFRRFYTPPAILHLSSIVPNEPSDKARFESFLPNIDPSIAELFFANAALIVEGQTERHFLHYLSLRTGREINQMGITIIESNGLGLMPSLIRVARSTVRFWHALCDGDLLFEGSHFDEYRKDMESALNLPIAKVPLGTADFEASRQTLHAVGLFVLPQKGIEAYYKSPIAIAKQEAKERINSADKGWLLSQEIDYLLDKNADYINQTYKELLAPLDSLIEAVLSVSNKPSLVSETIADITFDDGISLHREVYRNHWGENELRNFINGSRNMSAYVVSFDSVEKYELRWEAGQDVYRIRCEGIWVYVDTSTDNFASYDILRRGTIAKE